jgi:hypothetical protein
MANVQLTETQSRRRPPIVFSTSISVPLPSVLIKPPAISLVCGQTDRNLYLEERKNPRIYSPPLTNRDVRTNISSDERLQLQLGQAY